MNEFTRQPCRTNIVTLRDGMSRETKLRLELERQIRDQALREHNERERRLTARIGRVVEGVVGTVRMAWQAWGR